MFPRNDGDLEVNTKNGVKQDMQGCAIIVQDKGVAFSGTKKGKHRTYKNVIKNVVIEELIYEDNKEDPRGKRGRPHLMSGNVKPSKILRSKLLDYFKSFQALTDTK